jgi:hypothetical protein
MIRIAAILAGLLVLTGCGSVQSGSGSTRPPRATGTAGGTTTTLELGSYCWSAPNVTSCGDTGDPARFPGLPVIHTTRGATITIRLRFDPSGQVDIAIGHRHLQLEPARVLDVEVGGPGLLQIVAHHGSDDASYYGRIRLSP